MKKAVLVLLPLLAIGSYLALPQLRHHWALHQLAQRGIDLEPPRNAAPDEVRRLTTQKYLAEACQAAPDVLGLLLDAGLDPNASFEDGMTALHCAAMNGWVTQVQLLLAHGARPDLRMKAGGGIGDETRLGPMHLAAAWHHLPVVEVLHRHGASIDAPSEAGPPLMIALAFRWNERFAPPKGRLASEPDLLAVYRQFRRLGARAEGVDGRGNTLLHVAMRTRQQPLIEELLASGDFDLNAANLEGETPFMEHIPRGHGPADPAAAAADLALIGRMIDLGAQVSVRSRQGFAVILASAFWPELFDLLVERGADPFVAQSGGRSLWSELTHAPAPEVIALADRMPALRPPREADGKAGNGPLHVFAREPRPDLVAYFLKRGLSPDEANGAGDTPIHEALATSGGAYPHRDRTIAVLRLLLDAGANPNARNQAGEPPLMRACGHPPEVLQLLLAKGADVNAVTQWNGKPRRVLDCLAEHHNLEGFTLLVKAGATTRKQ